MCVCVRQACHANDVNKHLYTHNIDFMPKIITSTTNQLMGQFCWLVSSSSPYASLTVEITNNKNISERIWLRLCCCCFYCKNILKHKNENVTIDECLCQPIHLPFNFNKYWLCYVARILLTPPSPLPPSPTNIVYFKIKLMFVSHKLLVIHL